MIANDSSSSGADRPEPSGPLRLDLLESGRLKGAAAAFVAGRQRELLDPLTYLDPGQLPKPRRAPRPRQDLAAGLADANRSYGHSRADEMAARLADPETQVVVTGQQPGLLGGPLYALSKAVAAARWAEALERTGRKAVAVFWVATEDHDYAEVAASTFPAAPSSGGDVQTLDLGPDLQELMPVGMRHMGDRVERVLDELALSMPGDRYGAWIETLRRWYRPKARFGEAFCRLLPHLLGDRCPLVLDSMLPCVKRAQRPMLERLVTARREVDEALAASQERVVAAGHKPQVHFSPGVSPLFLLRESARRRVVWEGGSDAETFSLRGHDGGPWRVQELEQTVAENPGVLSAGVLARPVLQDGILGSSLQVLGPAELSYMAQVAPLYPLLDVTAPHTTLRPQVVVLDERQRGHLDELGIGLADLLGDRGELERRLAAATGQDFVAPVRDRVASLLDELREPTLAADRGLERPLGKTRDQVLRSLDQLAGKVAGSLARKNEIQRGRLDALRAAVLPSGKLQERVVSTAHFPGKYGEGFVESLWRQMDLDPRFLQVVTP